MLVTWCAAFLMPQAASAIAVGAFLMGNWGWETVPPAAQRCSALFPGVCWGFKSMSPVFLQQDRGRCTQEGNTGRSVGSAPVDCLGTFYIVSDACLRVCASPPFC